MPQDDFTSFEQSPSQEPRPAGSEGAADPFAEFEAGGGTAVGGETPSDIGFESSPSQATFTATASASGDATKDNLAIASTVVGVLSLCLAIIPLCGFPLSLTAIGLGAFSLKAPNRRTLAIVGLVLGGIAILISLCSGIFGVINYMNQGGY